MANSKTVKTVEFTLMTQILKADPDYYADLKKHPEYKFTNRTFEVDPGTRGAYS